MRRTVTEHQAAVLALLRHGWAGKFDGGEQLPLIEGLGRVAAEDVVAPMDLPPFANSQMDGFAVSSVDFDAGAAGGPGRRTILRAAATIPAGAVPEALRSGEAAPIMTGAMLPDGADAVVPVERADPPEFPDPRDGTATVSLIGAAAGDYVRAAGSDVRAGSLVIAAGTRLTAANLGLAAALGLTGLAVRRRPHVLLVATGDEVVLPGNGLPAGKIYDANSMLLHANLLEAGAEVLAAGLVRDDPAELLRLLDRYLAGGRIDLIVTSGGISAGAYEVVKQALAGEHSGEQALAGEHRGQQALAGEQAGQQALAGVPSGGREQAFAGEQAGQQARTGGPDGSQQGNQVEFCSVAMQPGGPQALGTVRGVPFLGFPGNPVSGVVSFEMFLRPALVALTGIARPRVRVRARLTEALASPAGKVQVRRAFYTDPDPAAGPAAGAPDPAADPAAAVVGCAEQATAAGTVTAVGGPSSHLLGSLAASNALIQIPADVTDLPAGSNVEVWLL